MHRDTVDAYGGVGRTPSAVAQVRRGLAPAIQYGIGPSDDASSRICMQCGGPLGGRRVVCSGRCRTARQNASAAGRCAKRRHRMSGRERPGRIWTAGYCATCGAAFVSMRHGAALCAACRPPHRLRATHPVPASTRAAVIVRFGLVCYLCHWSIDPATPTNHPAGFTIDHVWPVVLGRDDSIENLRPAHRRCNSRKGSKAVA